MRLISRLKMLVPLATCALAAGACANAGEADAPPADGPATPEPTPDTAALERRVTELAAPLVDPGGGPGKAVGMIVGVSSARGRTFVGLGATTKGGSTAPTDRSIFEIGSVTKVVTGLLLARAIERGEVTLDATIDADFPKGAPHYDGRAIALVDLATHTSGLPEMPTNLHGAPPNPGAGYTEGDLATFMATYRLRVSPSTQFAYSNLGAGTLGSLLVKRARASDYGSLVARDVARPLGLSDTTIALSAEQRARAVAGHSEGAPTPPNDIGEPLAGGGALRSTGDDMLRFAESALAGSGELATAWRLVLTPLRPSNSAAREGEGFVQTGLLIGVEDWKGTTLYTKSGGTAGFSSFVAFTTQPPAAVVVLTNTNGLHLADLARAVLAASNQAPARP